MVNTPQDQALLAAVDAALVDEVRSLNGYRQECQTQRPNKVALRNKYTDGVKLQKVGWSWTFFLFGLAITFAHAAGFEAFAVTNGTQQNEPALMQFFFGMLPMFLGNNAHYLTAMYRFKGAGSLSSRIRRPPREQDKHGVSASVFVWSWDSRAQCLETQIR